MKCTLLLLTVLAVLVTTPADAEAPKANQQKPPELNVLAQYAGNWTSDVTNKPAVWDRDGTKFRTSSQAEWILDGRFLQHIEVSREVGNPDKVGKSHQSVRFG